jgi:hypothetical protein
MSVTTKRKRLNWSIIKGDLAEAVEELVRLQRLASKRKLSEVQFQIGLRHAYHHLNFAWNARYVPTAQYRHLTRQQFDRSGKYPSQIDKL